jgi:hypothetical protein
VVEVGGHIAGVLDSKVKMFGDEDIESRIAIIALLVLILNIKPILCRVGCSYLQNEKFNVIYTRNTIVIFLSAT